MLNTIIFITLIILIYIPLSISYYIPIGNHPNTTLTNFAFGSCFFGRLSTRLDIFNAINQENPELWLWLGDAAYIDEFTMNMFKQTIDINSEKIIKTFNGSKNNECILQYNSYNPLRL